jgi:hypothetical protein
VVCSAAAEDLDARRLTREIVTFRAGDDGSAWTRSDEMHSLTLYDPSELTAALTRAGFEDARVLDGGYGPELELPQGIAVLSARAPAG